MLFRNSKVREFIKWFCPHGIVEARRLQRLSLERDSYNARSEAAKNYSLSLTLENLDHETVEVVDYVKRYGAAPIFPYEFKRKYCAEDVLVFYDPSCKLCFVLHKGKRLYFPRRYSIADVQLYYTTVFYEQDEASPHRYIAETSGFTVKEGDVLADVGAAEGIWALEYAHKAGGIYLFECEYEWILPLRKTFEPWKEKVEIVNKFVSNSDSGGKVSLDNFFKDKRVDFIKADIEGAELDMLKGARELLAKSVSLKLAICAYHAETDEKVLTETLKSLGFTTEHSQGYTIFLYDKKLEAPYLRRCLIRAKKYIAVNRN